MGYPVNSRASSWAGTEEASELFVFFAPQPASVETAIAITKKQDTNFFSYRPPGIVLNFYVEMHRSMLRVHYRKTWVFCIWSILVIDCLKMNFPLSEFKTNCPKLKNML